MPTPTDPLTIRVPELTGHPLSTKLAALADGIGRDDRLGRVERDEIGATLLILAREAWAMERKLAAFESASASMRRLGIGAA